jgi:hypothetical protein
MVAHVCNPSYLEGRDWEDHSLRPSEAKKITRPPTHTIKDEHGSALLSSSYSGNINRRILVQASLGINVRHYLKNN